MPLGITPPTRPAPAGTATLDLLRGYYSMLSPLLDSVACAPLPEGPVPRASSLHQRAWLLQVGFSTCHPCIFIAFYCHSFYFVDC